MFLNQVPTLLYYSHRSLIVTLIDPFKGTLIKAQCFLIRSTLLYYSYRSLIVTLIDPFKGTLIKAQCFLIRFLLCDVHPGPLPWIQPVEATTAHGFELIER